MTNWDNVTLHKIEINVTEKLVDFSYWFLETGDEPFSKNEFLPNSAIYKDLNELEKTINLGLDEFYD